MTLLPVASFLLINVASVLTGFVQSLELLKKS